MGRGVVYALIIVVLAGGIGAAYVLLSDDTVVVPGIGAGSEDDGESTPLADDLAGTRAEVALEIKVTTPKGFERGRHGFSGEGAADLEAGAAEIAYDFEDLTNAAGIFGHLDEFDVLFTEDGTYVDIFRDGPSWVRFEEGSDVARTDVGRLREVVLSSPTVLPALVRGAEAAGQQAIGRIAVSIASLEADTDMGAAVVALLEALGVDEVMVGFEAADGAVERVDYKLDFTAAAGTKKKVVVTIHAEIDPSDDMGEIEQPDESEVRDSSEFFG